MKTASIQVRYLFFTVCGLTDFEIHRLIDEFPKSGFILCVDDRYGITVVNVGVNEHDRVGDVEARVEHFIQKLFPDSYVHIKGKL